MFDITTMTDKELSSLIKIVAAEQKARAENHRTELIQNLCDAFNKAKSEIPDLFLNIKSYDEYGDCETIDIFDYFDDNLTINDFD